MARLFAAPGALAETARFLDGIAFNLDQLRYNYPPEPIPPGWRATPWLLHLVKQAAQERYGAAIRQAAPPDRRGNPPDPRQ
jgi:error-prone DNA polymerase